MNAVAQGIEEVRRSGTELGGYPVFGGRRSVYGYEFEAGTLLVDVPDEGTEGQLFTIDPCWRNPGTLGSFLVDYTYLGERAGCCPVDPYVERTAVRDAIGFDELVLRLYDRIGRS